MFHGAMFPFFLKQFNINFKLMCQTKGQFCMCPPFNSRKDLEHIGPFEMDPMIISMLSHVT